MLFEQKGFTNKQLQDWLKNFPDDIPILTFIHEKYRSVKVLNIVDMVKTFENVYNFSDVHESNVSKVIVIGEI